MEAFRDEFASDLPRVPSGDPRVPDMRHAAEILLGIRFQLDLYVNFRPCKLYDARLCPLKGKSEDDVDFVVFENTEGAIRRHGRQLQERGPPTRSPCRRRSAPARVERICPRGVRLGGGRQPHPGR
ncbi:MAG: hypothetical protein R2862_11325 [Thermoanaerobaculia bacterium]